MDDGDQRSTEGDGTVDERPLSARTRDSRESTPRITGERYRVGERLGRGGMGEVLLARDEQIGRDVAIKRIRTDEPSERTVKRFLREARIQGRLEHPAIVPVHELGRDVDGMPFFAMKRLAGTTLSKIIDNPARDRTKHSRQRLLRTFVDVCLAIEFAHVAGVIHRDLKPDNIMLGDFGEVYVLDWGVAKVVGEDDEFDDIKSDDLQTRTGTAIGTPGYMSPEQAMGETDIDARSDVYALGIVLGEILEADPEPPPELVAVRDRAIADKRDARLQTARELGEVVQAYLDGDRDLALRRALAKDHLVVAQSAMADREGFAARRKAMMQAGRALALDPELAEAGQLITQLIVEPPKDVPPEAQAQLEADKLGHARAIFRGSSWAAFAYLTLVPGLVAARSIPYAIAIAVVAIVSTTVSIRSMRKPASMWVVVAWSALLIVIVGRLYTPLFVAPGVAIALAAGASRDLRLRGRRASVCMWLILSLAVVIPAVAEYLGWIASTVTFNTDGTVLLHARAMASSLFPPIWIVMAYVLSMTGIAIIVGHYEREGAIEVRRAFHVQAWQVRQLMPDLRRR